MISTNPSFAAAAALLYMSMNINVASAADGVQILPLKISLDRAFDVQWNPPGYPILEATGLATPYGDSGETDGHYTFAKHPDGTMTFVRQKSDGSVCQVFSSVDFLVIGEDALLMNGDPDPYIYGGGFGTLIKGMSIPAGDAPGNYTATPIADTDSSTTAEAEAWLVKNFQDDSEAVPTPLTSIITCLAWYEDWTEETYDDDNDASDEKDKTEEFDPYTISIGSTSQSGASTAADGVQILPLKISLDRAFDVQWNPPGYPILEATGLATPYGDSGETDGHYTFAKHPDGTMTFVRQKSDGSVCQVFSSVDFLVIGEDALLMNGDPDPYIYGGGFGTLIKGMSIPAGDAPGNYTATPIADTDSSTTAEAEAWLVKNFQDDSEAVPTPLTSIITCLAWYEDWTEATYDDDNDASDEKDKTEEFDPYTISIGSTSQSGASTAADGVQILPLKISLDRAFDVQWNPPGYPILEATGLATPYGDSGETDGHYTFAKHPDGTMTFVRQKSDGSVCQVFPSVDFLVIGEDALLMNGDLGIFYDSVGVLFLGGFGTLIKGMSIPAGDTPGNYTATPIAIADNSTTAEAEAWLVKNFQDDPEAVPTPLTYFIACSAWYEDWYAAEHSTEATYDDDDDASDEEGKTKHSEIDTGGASRAHSALALQPQGVAPPSSDPTSSASLTKTASLFVTAYAAVFHLLVLFCG